MQLVLRFANRFFLPLWNRDNIDNVQVADVFYSFANIFAICQCYLFSLYIIKAFLSINSSIFIYLFFGLSVRLCLGRILELKVGVDILINMGMICECFCQILPLISNLNEVICSPSEKY